MTSAAGSAVRPSGGVSVLHKIFDDGFIRNKGLVRFGLPVAAFLGCNFNSLRIAKRFIAQLKKTLVFTRSYRTASVRRRPAKTLLYIETFSL
jgi:hypothetical protein